MPSSELIGKGITFANHAIECDHSACNTNLPSYFERAEANYEKAIELYSEALRLDADQATHSEVRPKIDAYTERLDIIKDWLVKYNRQQSKEIIARKKSNVQDVFPYVPEGVIQSPDPTGVPIYLTPSPPSNPKGRPLSAPHYVSPRIPSPTAQPGFASVPEAEVSPEVPRFSRLTPAIPVRDPLPTKPSNDTAIDELMTEINSLLLSNRESPKAQWDDVAGLSVAKDVLQEATTMSQELSTLFGKDRQRWKSVLLYGPPGCGKRVLAEAAAAAYKAQLLAPRVQDVLGLMSRSGSEGVRALFANAKKRGRAVLYLSDLEEMLGMSRGGGSSTMFRQARAQLLDELMGLRKGKDQGFVFIGASRTPWELDDALLSRLERRVYVGLPDAASRAQILEVGLRGVTHDITLQEIEDLAMECEGYSPSDLGTLVRDAAMEPVRVVRSAGWFKDVPVLKGLVKVTKKTPCERDATGAIESRFTELSPSEIHPPPVKCIDFDLAMTSTKPSVSREMIAKYIDFTEKKGQDGS